MDSLNPKSKKDSECTALQYTVAIAIRLVQKVDRPVEPRRDTGACADEECGIRLFECCL